MASSGSRVLDLPILYQDEVVLVVNKPSGLAVHRGEARDPVYALTLARDLVGRWVHPVHRLDRATSGALLFAFDKEHVAALQRQFEAEEGGVEKVYWAFVRGVMPDCGEIDYPLRRLEGDGPPLPAKTLWRRLALHAGFSLVEARPQSGRRHQIRRHLKHLSHPLIGDTTYGKGACNRHFREVCGLRRLALHAVQLSFTHPTQGRRCHCLAPLPADLAEPWRALDLPIDDLWRNLAAVRQENP